MPVSLSSLLVLRFLDFLKLSLSLIYLKYILFSFCIASPLLPISLIIALTQPKRVFHVISGEANQSHDLYFPVYLFSLAFSRATHAEAWHPTFSHRGLHSFPELPFINLIKFISDLTSNYSDYSKFMWRILSPFHFIKDNILQNNQLIIPNDGNKGFKTTQIGESVSQHCNTPHFCSNNKNNFCIKNVFPS